MKENHDDKVPILCSAAFFISPDYVIISVSGSHIESIIKNPQRFGLTHEGIRSLFEIFGEPLGLEGRARRKIIKITIQKGWIRLRRHKNRYWAVTVKEQSEEIMQYLQRWAVRILKSIDGVYESDPYLPVMITTLKGEVNRSYTVIDLSRYCCNE